MASVRDGRGRFVPQIETAERRAASAVLRSEGKTWQAIADAHWNGDVGTAFREVKKFWAAQPRETIEEIRATMVAKLDGLETTVREVMRRKHYVVAEGRPGRLGPGALPALPVVEAAGDRRGVRDHRRVAVQSPATASARATSPRSPRPGGWTPTPPTGSSWSPRRRRTRRSGPSCGATSGCCTRTGELPGGSTRPSGTSKASSAATAASRPTPTSRRSRASTATSSSSSTRRAASPSSCGSPPTR
jgi:hypothetical protein